MSELKSKYFTIKELTYSNPEIIKRLGITNIPTAQHQENLMTLATELLDKIREMNGGPLAITSGYRSKEYNSAIPNSSDYSQHMTGHAADLDCDVYGYGSNDRLFYIIKNFCEFDQLIWEFGNDQKPDWVHVSYVKGKNRKQCKKAVKISGKVHYINI
jgi:zinc D-Ala-D-Ala carboxypeptidase